MVSALDSRASVRGRALARDNVLCSWAGHFTLSTQMYKRVLANMLRVNPAMKASHPGGSRNNASLHPGV